MWQHVRKGSVKQGDHPVKRDACISQHGVCVQSAQVRASGASGMAQRVAGGEWRSRHGQVLESLVCRLGSLEFSHSQAGALEEAGCNIGYQETVGNGGRPWRRCPALTCATYLCDLG